MIIQNAKKYWDGFRVVEEDENYLYDFSDTTRDYDGNWNLKKEYFRGAAIDEIIFEKTSDGEIRYYYTDALGSTRQLCDADGNILQKFKYDAWGTMQVINPKLYSEKGTVEGVLDLNLDDNSFEITLDSVNNTAELSIIIMNTGEDNSILEYSMFSENKPSGVYFNNNHGNINAADSQTAKIEIDGDYFPTGDTNFQIMLNSNSQTGETYHTYNITVHKEYDLVYQEWYTGEEEVKTVLQKPEFLTRYTYTGREYNRETGQYYYRARTYASGLGRFTGKDPVGYPGYNYVKNNPMKYNDPSGLKKRKWPANGQAINRTNKNILILGERKSTPEGERETWELEGSESSDGINEDIDAICLNGTWYRVWGANYVIGNTIWGVHKEAKRSDIPEEDWDKCKN